jgi:hypothetical protein
VSTSDEGAVSRSARGAKQRCQVASVGVRLLRDLVGAALVGAGAHNEGVAEPGDDDRLDADRLRVLRVREHGERLVPEAPGLVR